MTDKAGVLWLEEIDEGDRARVGGKAFNLGRLMRAGLDVPGGFVVGAASPQSILDAFRRLSGEVAVRSSGVYEDSGAASFAGQGRTLLNVRTEEDLLRAVATVRASETGAEAYGRRLGVRMGAAHVIVQEMVPASVSGVLFTSQPVSGREDEVLVNATWGLGEPLVSGSITPDEYVVDKQTGRCKRRTIGAKEETLTREGLGPTDPERASAACLGKEQIRTLARAARKIEQHFGSPQDVEWAWHGGLFILQARPIGVGPESIWPGEMSRLRAMPDCRGRVWVASGIAELLPCPTPISWEVASRLMSGDTGYGLAQRLLGFDPAPGTVLERIGGHIYVDLDRECRLFFRHAPLGIDVRAIAANPLRAALARTGFRWRKVRAGLLVRWPLLAFGFARCLLRQRRCRRDIASFETGFLPRFLERVESERRRELTALPAPELAAEFEARLQRFLTESAPVLMAASTLAAMSYRELEDQLIHRMGREGIALAQELTAGLKPNPALEMHESMLRLAAGELDENEFVGRYGHRCGGGEFELAVPRWREDRESLRLQIAQLKDAASDRGPRGADVRRAADAKLVKASGSWGRVGRELVQRRLVVARRLLPLRERSKDLMIREFELLRAPLAELDRRAGLGGGIYYLCPQELASAEGWGEQIEARRREHELCRRLDPPQVIVGSLLRERSKGPEDGMTGLGVSPGEAQGPVRVLASVTDLCKVRQGEVLVVRSLDPTWTAAYAKAAALVAERGASLSHGAILAREFGLPAIVVPGAASRLEEGRSVRVDGSAGSVRRMGDSP